MRPDYRWVHIDVVDGKFARVTTWGSPDDLKRFHSQFPDIKFEIHLMVENYDRLVGHWLDAGAKRLVIQAESAGDPEIARIMTEDRGAEVIFSGGPAISAEKMLVRGRNFKFFQVLAVNPGFAGQEFGTKALDKISFLRKHVPNAKIELDGGVNPKVAKEARAAGADIAVSASHIFDSANPMAAYEELRNI
jgi:ribulose-phosphate 3-epimerase